MAASDDAEALLAHTDDLLAWLQETRGLDLVQSLRVLAAAISVITNHIDRPDIYDEDEGPPQ